MTMMKRHPVPSRNEFKKPIISVNQYILISLLMIRSKTLYWGTMLIWNLLYNIEEVKCDHREFEINLFSQTTHLKNTMNLLCEKENRTKINFPFHFPLWTHTYYGRWQSINYFPCISCIIYYNNYIANACVICATFTSIYNYILCLLFRSWSIANTWKSWKR